MFEHPAATARARCIRAQMLQTQDWHGLVHATDFAAALTVLLGTTYRNAFGITSVHPDALPSMRTIEHALHLAAIGSMQKLLRFIHGPSGTVPEILLQRYDLLNLKKTLRRLSQPERHESRLAIENYDLGSCALIPKAQWDSINTTQDLGKQVETTYYRRAYQMGMASFADAKDLLVFESTLEHAYYDELATRMQALAGTDRAGLCALMGNYLDEACLSAFARLRYLNRLDPSAVFPLLPLHACTRFTAKVFWVLAKTDTEQAGLQALGAQSRWTRLVGASIGETCINLRRERRLLCRRAFIRSSAINLAPVIACYFLKELEVRDLVAVLQSKRFNMPVKQEACVLMDLAAA